MKLPDISDPRDIKNLRKDLDLNLKKMANGTKLSVSWIDQVERGRIKDPSYLKMKQIFDFYEYEQSGNDRTAGDICVKVKSVKSDNTDSSLKSTDKFMRSCNIGSPIESAKEIMLELDISQVPVFEKNDVKEKICVGMITDKKINEFVGYDVTDVRIDKEMLEIPPPKVDVKTQVRSLKRTLDYFPYVLVEEDGKLVGILARFDLMELLGEEFKINSNLH